MLKVLLVWDIIVGYFVYDLFRIRFTIVSEPLDEDDEDCSDVGAAYVSIPDILRKEEDIVNREIPSK